MDTISNYDGRKKFKVPTNLKGLAWIVEHDASDGCTFTYEMLDAAGARPPVRDGYTFAIRYGELFAEGPDGSPTWSFDMEKWVELPQRV
jgi:hypothetical protein